MPDYALYTIATYTTCIPAFFLRIFFSSIIWKPIADAVKTCIWQKLSRKPFAHLLIFTNAFLTSSHSLLRLRVVFCPLVHRYMYIPKSSLNATNVKRFDGIKLDILFWATAICLCNNHEFTTVTSDKWRNKRVHRFRILIFVSRFFNKLSRISTQSVCLLYK